MPKQPNKPPMPDFTLARLERRYWLCMHGLEIRTQCPMCDEQYNLDLGAALERQKERDDGE